MVTGRGSEICGQNSDIESIRFSTDISNDRHQFNVTRWAGRIGSDIDDRHDGVVKRVQNIFLRFEIDCPGGLDRAE